jgi:hypothetical protein
VQLRRRTKEFIRDVLQDAAILNVEPLLKEREPAQEFTIGEQVSLVLGRHLQPRLLVDRTGSQAAEVVQHDALLDCGRVIWRVEHRVVLDRCQRGGQPVRFSIIAQRSSAARERNLTNSLT